MTNKQKKERKNKKRKMKNCKNQYIPLHHNTVATAYKRGRKNERMEKYQQPDGETERG